MRRVNSVVVSAPRNSKAGGSLSLPFLASSAREARKELNAWLKGMDLGGTIAEDARLVVSELIGNSIRHAHPLADGTLKVTWKQGRHGLEISVTDGGATTSPHKVNAAASAVSGRGLAIIETLASRWWAESGRSGTTVHALLRLG